MRGRPEVGLAPVPPGVVFSGLFGVGFGQGVALLSPSFTLYQVCLSSLLSISENKYFISEISPSPNRCNLEFASTWVTSRAIRATARGIESLNG